MQQQQEPTPDVRLDRKQAQTEVADRLPMGETPCFPIEHLQLVGEASEQFQWALSAVTDPSKSPIGRCLGTEGINLVMKWLQNAIVKAGYVTTRVLAEPQDLKSGTLRLTLIPGRIRTIRFAAETSGRATHWNAFPMAAGDLLNLRDIEQALENLKRVPTAESDIQITPSEAADAKPGDSDLVVSWKQTFPLRLSITADDAGSKATGKEQGSLTVSGDHLLSLNDLFYVTINSDLANKGDQYGTRGRTLHYSVPFGYWLLGLTSSNNSYHQSVAGVNQAYVYRGISQNNDIRLSRLIWRDQSSKTTLGLRGWQRSSKNFIDDTEILVQQRRMAGWEININQKVFLKEATFDGNLAFRQGTGAMRSQPAPEEAFNEGTSRPQLITADAQFNQAFSLGTQRLRYNLVWRAQWNLTPLVPQDRFAIGGRYTVRGFDGESILSSDRGWLVRNDLGFALGNTGQEAYLGLDYGHLGGRSAEFLLGKELAGAVLGLRGNLIGVSYDFFVGQPIDKPQHFRTADTTAGFSLYWSL